MATLIGEDLSYEESAQVDCSLQDILSDLFPPFQNVAPYLLAQVFEIVDGSYNGDGIRFMHEFLVPVKALLQKLRSLSRLNLRQLPCDEGWPLCHDGNIIIHLCELACKELRPGDFYFYVKEVSEDTLLISLKYYVDQEVHDILLPPDSFEIVFTMEWMESVNANIPTRSESETNLEKLVVGNENGLKRLDWKDVVSPSTLERKPNRKSKIPRPKLSESSAPSSPKINSKIPRPKAQLVEGQVKVQRSESLTSQKPSQSPKRYGSLQRNSQERLSSRLPRRDGSLNRSDTNSIPEDDESCSSIEDLHQAELRRSGRSKSMQGIDRKRLTADKKRREKMSPMERLGPPKTLMEVDFELVHSGAFCLTSARDIHGAAVIEVSACHPIWIEQISNIPDTTQLLTYLFSIPREDVTKRGLTVVVDARKPTNNTLDFLAEAVNMFQDSFPGTVFEVVLLEHSVPLGRFSSQSNCPFNIPPTFKFHQVRSLEKLYQFVPAQNLTNQFNGTFNYNHEAWVKFRMKLEPFMSGCRSAAKYLLGSIEELAKMNWDGNSDEINDLIEKVKAKHKMIYRDQRLAGLLEEGDAILKALQDEQGTALAGSEDFRDAIRCVSNLYNQVHEACGRVDAMAENKVSQLSQHLQLRIFEEEATKLCDWLSQEGEPRLDKIDESQTDSLASIISVQKEFEKFYYVAMKRGSKGEELLEESESVITMNHGSETNNVRTLGRELRQQLRSFMTRLEGKRVTIDDAVELYSMLDKSYEWALGGMKFVAMLGIEEINSCDKCIGQEKKIDDYLEKHPPITEEQFEKMRELSKRLRKQKCLQQCEFAEKRCSESNSLIHKKLLHLQEAKEKLKLKENEKYALEKRTQRQQETIPAEKSVRFNRNEESEVNSGNSSDGELFRRTQIKPTTTPPKHRDSFHSNVSEDSGISIGDKNIDRTLNITQERNDESINKTAIETQSPSMSGQTIEEEKVETTSDVKVDEGYVEKDTEEEVEETKSDSSRSRKSGVHEMATESSSSKDGSDRIAEVEEEEEISIPEQQWKPHTANRHLRNSVVESPLKSVRLKSQLSDGNFYEGKKMLMIIDEIIQTEEDYVMALKYIMQNYFPEMDRDDVPQGLRGQRTMVFGNIEKIYDFHQHSFLNDLVTCEAAPMDLCQCFLRHTKDFGLYALYNKNKPRSDELLAEYGSFFKTKQHELGDKMDVASYLLKPVQRMGKYALLLRDLIKECGESNQELLAYLKTTESMVKFQLRHGNDLLAMDAIRDSDITLHEQGQLIRQEEFLVYRGKKKCWRHIFLFEDTVVFTKTRQAGKGHDHYQYKSSLKTNDIGITESVGESGLKFEIWFRRMKHKDKRYTLHAPSVNVKKEWVDEITQLLWRQAVKSKESRLSELSYMGIGSKPCIDIKPNEDQINDRAIEFKNRGIRSRNSISVASFDHHQVSGHQRPFSVLSNESSSSSTTNSSSMISSLMLETHYESVAEISDFPSLVKCHPNQPAHTVGSSLTKSSSDESMFGNRRGDDSISSSSSVASSNSSHVSRKL
ncbi:puratrophin-1-like isoform X2 [Antedon mediterranea]|uniref:puratrophin-1-like isoform X2 n=1 Tax=Antedon mediterranea TaxID=105859 RepID=UPI003AF480AC